MEPMHDVPVAMKRCKTFSSFSCIYLGLAFVNSKPLAWFMADRPKNTAHQKIFLASSHAAVDLPEKQRQSE
jgi:hypothetical protein